MRRGARCSGITHGIAAGAQLRSSGSSRPAAQAQTLTTIHAFNGVNGVAPVSGVTLRAGALYGTTLCTRYCNGNGSVYQIIPVGSSWYFTPISLFSAGGSLPEARVVFGPDNRLYGTTTLGGRSGLWRRLQSHTPSHDLQNGKLLFDREGAVSVHGQP